MHRPVDGYLISEGLDDAELPRAHAWIARESYWAAGVPFEVFRRAVEHSLMFGARHADDGLAAMARVVTDRATFAWVCDVFVAEAHRGRGLGGRLMEAIRAHPDLQGLRRIHLATRDAHSLYARYGFEPLSAPDRWMQIHDPDVYTR